jgi:homoserine dehydrogenase
MQNVRIVLVGLGNLGRRFCMTVADKQASLAERYGLNLMLVGAADSRGVAYAPEGLDMSAVAALKATGGTIADYPDVGRSDWDAVALVEAAEADVLMDASPVNLPQGAEPGLTCIRTAMNKGRHVITPNKGPLVVAFHELHELAREKNVAFRYDGTVAGGLPALNVGCRDLRGAYVSRLEAVPNLVTGYVMDMLAEGISWEEATAKARAEGALESPPEWDLDGWDAAAKLVILANAILGCDAKIDDVERAGVSTVPVAELAAALERGEKYRLLAKAELQDDGSYKLSALPTSLKPEHPLGHMGSKQMGVVYTTDIYGTITFIIDEPDPVPSSATMLRDLLDIYVDDSTTLVI